MAEKTQAVAREILNVIPQVMRKINAELKQKSLGFKKANPVPSTGFNFGFAFHTSIYST